MGCGINPLIYIFRCERFRTEIKRVINKTFGLDGLLWGDAIKNKSGLFKPGKCFADSLNMSEYILALINYKLYLVDELLILVTC